MTALFRHTTYPTPLAPTCNCCNSKHIKQIDLMYNSIIDALKAAAGDDVLTVKSVNKNDTQILGWNDIVKAAHECSREAFLLWRSNLISPGMNLL